MILTRSQVKYKLKKICFPKKNFDDQYQCKSEHWNVFSTFGNAYVIFAEKKTDLKDLFYCQIIANQSNKYKLLINKRFYQ